MTRLWWTRITIPLSYKQLLVKLIKFEIGREKKQTGFMLVGFKARFGRGYALSISAKRNNKVMTYC